MDRSEPALVPEWLRSSGSVAGAGNSAQHFASSSSHTDSHSPSAAHNNRNRSSKNTSDFDSSRSVFLDRTSSSSSRRSSINGSAKHAYSSFNRNHRDKDRDREKDRSNFGDHWDRDGSDPLANLFSGRIERDTLRRSHSMISRKQSEILPRRVAADNKSGGSSNHNNGNGSGNGVLSGGSVGSSIQKAVFDKDFPSLGAEEKQGISEIGRVSSPVFGATASQSLPVGSSALIGGEGWTSALVEVPSVIGSNSAGSLSAQQTVAATSGSVSSSTSAGLNMAEALAQAPSRARLAPQVSVQTQRMEELAIKQSRQLIPVTPSIPKTLVLNSSEKKPKTAVRNAEMNVATKSVPQQPSALHIANQSVRSINAKVDVPKTSGKFTDLKSVVWENGASPTSKDVSNPANYANSKSANQHAVASASSPTPVKNPNKIKSPTERRPASLDLKLGSTFDKKQSISQVKSRNDFFNLIKNKTSTNSSTVLPDSGPMVSSPTLEKSGEVKTESAMPSASPQSVGNEAELTRNGNAHAREELSRISDDKEEDSIDRAMIHPDEEEAAFLRSLGWEENSDEDEGLTEEEINAFYQECKKLDPSTLKLCIEGLQPKLSKLFDSCATNLCGASAELSSSDARSEA